MMSSSFVIPAEAGTHLPPYLLPQGSEMDPRLRGNDGICGGHLA